MKSRGVRARRRQAWPSTARTAAAAGAVAVLALAAAACGSSSGTHVAKLGSATQSASSTNGATPKGSVGSAALEFSQCMRSHGVTKFPDFNNANRLRNGLPKISVSMQQLGISSSQFQTAQTACGHLLPNGGPPTPTASQQDLRDMLRFARCMRSHGVPTWPDPANGPAGWGFNLLNVQGFDPNSAQIENKMNVCQQVLPAGVSIPLSRPAP